MSGLRRSNAMLPADSDNESPASHNAVPSISGGDSGGDSNANAGNGDTVGIMDECDTIADDVDIGNNAEIDMIDDDIVREDSVATTTPHPDPDAAASAASDLPAPHDRHDHDHDHGRARTGRAGIRHAASMSDYSDDGGGDNDGRDNGRASAPAALDDSSASSSSSTIASSSFLCPCCYSTGRCGYCGRPIRLIKGSDKGRGHPYERSASAIGSGHCGHLDNHHDQAEPENHDDHDNHDEAADDDENEND